MRQSMPMPPAPQIPAHPVSALAAHRLRVGKLCVAIQASSATEMVRGLRRRWQTAKFLEFRLDSLPKPGTALPKLKEFLADHRDVTAIATCRRKKFGGTSLGP
jgi:3-dehydroquinate dehydratase/shikimate dehydrogenase